MVSIDINCDMGEGIANEAWILPYISSANIACGFHAGDESEMERMVELCLRHRVAIGAHPSFPDRANFGRREMDMQAGEIQQMVREQLSKLSVIAISAGAQLHHVKPHGALYNMAARDGELASLLAKTVKDFDESLVYYGLSGSVMIDKAAACGLKVAHEVFADRTYQADGSLTPRSMPLALIRDPAQAIQQALQMVLRKEVSSSNGILVPVIADTICIHGDGLNAVELARELNSSLVSAGISIAAPLHAS